MLCISDRYEKLKCKISHAKIPCPEEIVQLKTQYKQNCLFFQLLSVLPVSICPRRTAVSLLRSEDQGLRFRLLVSDRGH